MLCRHIYASHCFCVTVMNDDDPLVILTLSEVRHINLPSGGNWYHMTPNIVLWSHYTFTECCCTCIDVFKSECRLLRWCRNYTVCSKIKFPDLLFLIKK